MAKKVYLVKNRCSYGEKGDLVELDGDLTDRQKVMLTDYKAPAVKKAESKDKAK